MTFGKTMRVQMMVAGLGMALFCAGATRAQEIVNTTFPDGPNVAPLAQPAMPSGSVATVTESQPIAPNAQLPAVAASVNDTRTSEMMVWIGASLIWLGAIGMYFSGPAKRFAGELLAMRKSYKLSDAA
jgi:hypothetical protein